MKVHNRIFWVGLPRTGTTTFSTIMRRLGFRHQGNCSKLNVEDVKSIFEFIDNSNYQSFDDHPWCDVWKYLADRYEDAMFVNLVRDPIDWRKSMMKMATNTVKTVDEIRELAFWRVQLFQDYLDDPTGIQFVNRNKEVKDYFTGCENFIELDWRYNDYQDLCNFLKVNAPLMTMPKVDEHPTVNEKGLKRILQFFNSKEKRVICEALDHFEFS